MGLEVRLAISASGAASIGERGECEEGRYDTIPLLDEEIEEIELAICKDDDVPKGSVCVEISGYHMENRGNNRAFHGHLKVFLERTDVERVRAYLDFLLFPEE